MPLPFLAFMLAALTGSPDSLAAGDTAVAELPPMQVREQRRPSSRVRVDERELLVGETDDLNNLLYLEPNVARTPEAGSQMMVEGDSPFDNLIYVQDIPLLAPSHFAGLLFTDRSIVPMALPNQVDFHTSDLAGQFGGASGSLLRVQPGFADSEFKPHRVQALLNYGTLGADITLMVPLYRARQRYQLTYRVSDRFSIWMDNMAFGREGGNPYLGYAEPSSFYDVQFIGEQRVGRLVIRELSFTSMDNYVSELDTIPAGVVGGGQGFIVEESRFPWGVHGITVGDSCGPKRWQVTVGGSSQYHFSGTRVDTVNPVIELRHTTGSVVAHAGPSLFSLPMTLRVDALLRDWEGDLSWKHLHVDEDSATGPVKIARNQRDGRIGMHLGFTRALNSATLGANVCAGLLLPGPHAAIDPGLTMRFLLPNSHVHLATGMVTLQPDVRGLPSSSFRETRIHTLRADAEAVTTPRPWLTLTLNTYGKYRDHALVLTEDPRRPVWDETREASQMSLGTSFGADIRAGRRLRLWTQQSHSYTRLIESDSLTHVPWDIPWTNKSVLSVAFVPDHVTLYLTGTFAGGTPYRAPVYDSGELRWSAYDGRTPVYKRVDAKLELRHEADRRSHILRYDAYVLLENIGSGFRYLWGDEWEENNVREYWWDSNLQPQPIYLSPFDVHFGVRAHVRF